MKKMPDQFISDGDLKNTFTSPSSSSSSLSSLSPPTFHEKSFSELFNYDPLPFFPPRHCVYLFHPEFFYYYLLFVVICYFKRISSSFLSFSYLSSFLSDSSPFETFSLQSDSTSFSPTTFSGFNFNRTIDLNNKTTESIPSSIFRFV
jgi:hypothetical protein